MSRFVLTAIAVAMLAMPALAHGSVYPPRPESLLDRNSPPFSVDDGRAVMYSRAERGTSTIYRAPRNPDGTVGTPTVVAEDRRLLSVTVDGRSYTWARKLLPAQRPQTDWPNVPTDWQATAVGWTNADGESRIVAIDEMNERVGQPYPYCLEYGPTYSHNQLWLSLSPRGHVLALASLVRDTAFQSSAWIARSARRAADAEGEIALGFGNVYRGEDWTARPSDPADVPADSVASLVPGVNEIPDDPNLRTEMREWAECAPTGMAIAEASDYVGLELARRPHTGASAGRIVQRWAYGLSGGIPPRAITLTVRTLGIVTWRHAVRLGGAPTVDLPRPYWLLPQTVTVDVVIRDEEGTMHNRTFSRHWQAWW